MTGALRLLLAAAAGALAVEARHATESSNPTLGLVMSCTAIVVAAAAAVGTIADEAATRRTLRRARRWQNRAEIASQANDALRLSLEATRRIADVRGETLDAVLGEPGWAATLADIQDLSDTGPGL